MEKLLRFTLKRRLKNRIRSGRLLMICFIIFIFGTESSFANSFQQEPITVTGTVTDANGIPLPGVTVMEKNTNNGTTTDFDGNYSIEVDSSEDILVFSYVGMKTFEEEVGNNTVLDVQLENDPQALEEVVLVGYGKQEKISVVGAQSTIETQELQQPVSNIGTMLAGRVAGLTGVQRSGLPGKDAADIWIRGIGTFANSRPLILIDGVERSLDNLNPIDIASFTILKDASATAVYGVRGANGVILIETKKGKIGKPEVMVDYFEGITYFTQVPELIDGVTYMRLANEALTTRGEEPKYSEEYIERTANNFDPMLYPNVDWMDEVFNDFGSNRKVTVNVNGGAQDTRYYVSLGYYDEKGLFVTDALESYDSDTRFRRYNITSNLTIDITNTTSMVLGVRGYLSEGNYPSQGVGGIFSAAMEAPPVEYPVLYPGGFVPGKSAQGGLRNPYAEVALRGFRNEIQNSLNSNLRLTQELSFLTEGLSLTGMFAFDTYNEHNIWRDKRESTYFVDRNNPYTRDGELLLNETYTGNSFLGFGHDNGGERKIYMEASLNYDRTFGKHTFGGLLLGNRSDRVDAFADNFTASIPYRTQGLAGRITYGYDDTYFLEVNAGYNGSENFAPENRYGFFPSVAVGWIISNENFFEPFEDVIDFLKIRYSDGLVGASSGAGRFAYLNRVEDGQPGYEFGANPSNTGGIRETYYGVNVTWSESRKQDLGIELNAFDNSLQIVFDLFKEYTEGAFLRRRDIPNYIGLYDDPFGNIGVIENKGFDGSINYNQSFNDLNISFRGTFSYNKNKVIENGQPDQPYAWMEGRGEPLLARFGYVAERLYTLDDDVNGDGFISPEDGEEYPTQFGQIMPGDIKYKDLNGDGQIDSYDRRVIGQGDVPALTYGFGLYADYKNFDVSVFFQGQEDADMMMGGQSIHPFVGGGGTGNLYTVATDRWTPESDDPYAMYPRLSYGSSGIGQSNNTQASTWWQRDIDFLRLKTAEIGYNLPSDISDKWGLGNVRFYARATNLLTITDFDLWDPELSTTSNGSKYPHVSAVSIGLNVIF